MILVVASEGLDVSSCFESCTNYNCFTIENGEITDYRNLPLLANQRDSIADLLCDLGVSTVITGSISEPTKAFLEARGLSIHSNKTGEAKQLAEAYITDTFIACDDSCD